MAKARVRFPGRMKPIGLSVNPGNQIGISLDPPTQSLAHLSTDTQKDILEHSVTTKTVGSGFSELMGGESQIESSSNDSVNSNTHSKGTKTDQVASQPMKSNQDNGPETAVPESWEELQNEMPHATGSVSSEPLERTICADGPNRNNVALCISADNAETTQDCNDALEPPNRKVIPKLNDESVSRPSFKGNESSEATAMVLATKLSSRTTDKGPP